VLEADGIKQAAVTVAEGSKQAAILEAEGDRQAAILRAEGFALALSKIFEVAHTVDANTMRLQYLDALKQIGTSDSTKIVVPMDLGDLIGRAKISVGVEWLREHHERADVARRHHPARSVA
jgi:regulator of protease activity HflC (stomatin/prohibitin superfamily)